MIPTARLTESLDYPGEWGPHPRFSRVPGKMELTSKNADFGVRCGRGLGAPSCLLSHIHPVT